jgi:hypothetical protein
MVATILIERFPKDQDLSVNNSKSCIFTFSEAPYFSTLRTQKHHCFGLLLEQAMAAWA